MAPLAKLVHSPWLAKATRSASGSSPNTRCCDRTLSRVTGVELLGFMAWEQQASDKGQPASLLQMPGNQPRLSVGTPVAPAPCASRDECSSWACLQFLPECKHRSDWKMWK